MSIRKICTIFNEEGKDYCISEVLKAYVPSINVQIDDDAVHAYYHAARAQFCEILDEKVIDLFEKWAKDKTEKLTEKQCKLLDLARTAIGNYIVFQLVQVTGTVNASGDKNMVAGKLSSTNQNQNARNCWHFLNRFYDAVEELIYKCLCPLLLEKHEDISDLLPANELSFVQKIESFFIPSPAVFKECENLKEKGGQYSVFLQLSTHFKHAENALKSCICDDFLKEMKAFSSKFSSETPNPKQQILLDLIQAFIANYAKYRYERVDSKTATRNGNDFIQKNPHTTRRTIYQNETTSFSQNLSEEQNRYFQQIIQFLKDNKNEKGFETYLSCYELANPEIENQSSYSPCNTPENSCPCAGKCGGICKKNQSKFIHGQDGHIIF